MLQRCASTVFRRRRCHRAPGGAPFLPTSFSPRGPVCFPARTFGSQKDNNPPEKVEYVHPLSQLVLEHLQTTRSDWVERNGLDRGLELQSDGTFILKFPSYDEDRARIW